MNSLSSSRIEQTGWLACVENRHLAILSSLQQSASQQQQKRLPTTTIAFPDRNRANSTMSYFIAAISNGGGAPEQAYRKMQAAGACPEKPFAGKFGNSVGFSDFAMRERESASFSHLPEHPSFQRCSNSKSLL